MLTFLLQRLLWAVPLWLGITVLCFGVMRLAPGDPTQLMNDLDPKAHANAAMRTQAGLDAPLPVQYIRWLGQLMQGNLGTSLAPDGLPVAEKIAEALPLTLWLNGLGLGCVLVIGLVLGRRLALTKRAWLPPAVNFGLLVLLAMPGVWLALLLLQWLGVQLGWFPLSGLHSYGAEDWPWLARLGDMLWHLALPLLVGVLGSLAGMVRYAEGSFAAAWRQDYVLTARAKGASPWRVHHHAQRNALLPLITLLGLSLPGLLGGSVIIESLFALPGMGKLFFDAVLMRDYPVIMALLTCGAGLTLLGNLLADVAYAWADPRVHSGGVA